MTRQEVIDITHPNWKSRGEWLYYGDHARGVKLEFANYRFFCWDEPGPEFLFDGRVCEFQALAITQADPEEVIAEYARRAAE